MNIKNAGDMVEITLDTGHTVTYDGTKAKRLTGNDLHRFIGQIIATAIESFKVPAGPVEAAAVFNPWDKPSVAKLPPISNPGIHVEEPYVPSGLSQDDGD